MLCVRILCESTLLEWSEGNGLSNFLQLSLDPNTKQVIILENGEIGFFLLYQPVPSTSCLSLQVGDRAIHCSPGLSLSPPLFSYPISFLQGSKRACALCSTSKWHLSPSTKTKMYLCLGTFFFLFCRCTRRHVMNKKNKKNLLRASFLLSTWTKSRAGKKEVLAPSWASICHIRSLSSRKILSLHLEDIIRRRKEGRKEGRTVQE